MRKKTNSRRNFLKKSVIVPPLFIVPRHVLGGKGFIAPSDKLNIAAVGVRKWGMGSNNIHQCRDENIVALCDVDLINPNQHLIHIQKLKFTKITELC